MSGNGYRGGWPAGAPNLPLSGVKGRGGGRGVTIGPGTTYV